MTDQFDTDAALDFWQRLEDFGDADARDWYEALVYAALDHVGGDLAKALEVADGALEENESPPESHQDVDADDDPPALGEMT